MNVERLLILNLMSVETYVVDMHVVMRSIVSKPNTHRVVEAFIFCPDYNPNPVYVRIKQSRRGLLPFKLQFRDDCLAFSV